MTLLLAICSGFALSLAAPLVYRVARGATGWLLAMLPFALLAYFAGQAGAIAAGDPVRSHVSWAPSLGVELSFYVDGLSLLFAMLISGVGGVVLIYAGGYLAGHPRLGLLQAYLLAFMASMLGLVCADNLLALFVFWELTSVTSYLLIGFDHERPQARAAALQALLVTGAGGLALLAGFILLGQAAGTLNLSEMPGAGEELRSHAFYLPVVLLILLGAFTKSAQFPFHFWLPGAMEAPTPVSAYLHSATMVKAGVYLIARLSPILGGTETWTWIVSAAGAATMVVGGWLALVQADLKRILAYSTVSALGTLTLLLGRGEEHFVVAAMTLLLGHALYKGALFLVAGTLDHETGTRDVDRLRGLGRAMPATAAAGAMAALSMAGLPPFLGFVAKELTYEAMLGESGNVWLMGIGVVTSALFVAVAVLTGLRPFLGRIPADFERVREASPSLWIGALAFGVLGALGGIWPAAWVDALVAAASSAVRGESIEVGLHLWHGWTPALALSAASLAIGLALVRCRQPLRRLVERWKPLAAWGPAACYELGLRGVNGLAWGQTRLLQNGMLRYYLMVTFAATIAIVGGTLLTRGALAAPGDWQSLRFYDVGVSVLILLATIASVLVRSRLAAIASLGVVGYGVALVFVLFGAPDVAMTQFLVETLTVILFVLVFYHLSPSTIVSPPWARLRDAGLALAVGTLMAAFVLLASSVQFHPSISRYFAENSFPLGHGRNVVNVILVDFRALDTLGEITVLAVAGIGVYALLKLRPAARPPGGGGSP